MNKFSLSKTNFMAPVPQAIRWTLVIMYNLFKACSLFQVKKRHGYC